MRRRGARRKEQPTTRKPNHYCPADEMKSDDDEINGTKYDAKDAEDARNAVPV